MKTLVILFYFLGGILLGFFAVSFEQPLGNLTIFSHTLTELSMALTVTFWLMAVGFDSIIKKDYLSMAISFLTITFCLIIILGASSPGSQFFAFAFGLLIFLILLYIFYGNKEPKKKVRTNKFKS